MLQQIALGGTMIALPIYLQMVLEYNAMQAGLSLAPLSLSMFAVALLAGQAGGQAAPEQHHPRRASRSWPSAWLVLIPIVPRADSGWSLVVPLIIAGCGLGLLVSQLNNYTLVADLRGAGQRGGRRQLGGGSFGLSFGLAFAGAIMLATLSFSLHQHGRRQHGAAAGRAAAGRRRARATTPR